MTTKIKTMMDNFTAMQAKFVAEGQATFKEVLKETFENFPELKVIKWTQYSPYFNDGEECVFGVNAPTFSNASDADEVLSYGEYTGEEEGAWLFGENVYGDDETTYENRPDANPEMIKVMNDIDELIQSPAFENIAEMMFGNHAEVTVTREGIQVDGYDHD